MWRNGIVKKNKRMKPDVSHGTTGFPHGVCSKCNVRPAQFYHAYCKECRAAYMREYRAVTKGKLRIPDLCTDEDIVGAVDELKHRLRSGAPPGEWSTIRSSLDRKLRFYIIDNGLDGDQHMHASLPKEHEDTPESVG